MKRKLLSLLLTASMAAALLAGCGASEDVPSGGNDKPSSTEPTGGDDVDDGDDEDEETAEIVVGLMCFAPIDTAVQDRIEAAVNEKMEAMINVTADFQWYDASTYATQIPMMISSGEQLDVIMFTPVPAAGYSSFMSQNQLMDISEYIDEYGADIKSELGEAGLAATSRGDGVYGTGAVFANFGGQAICVRADVLEELNLTDAFNAMTKWSDFEEIMKAIVASGKPGLINSDAEGTILAPQPYVAGPDDFAGAYWCDIAGDGNQMIYIDQETAEVKCYYKNPDYRDVLLRSAEYYKEGLMYKDAATAEEYADTQIKNGVGTAMVKTLEFGWEDSLPASCGYPMAVKFVDGAMNLLGTSAYTKFGFAVPVTSQEPEAAVKFINLMYSENEVHNTLVWGVEGTDWAYVDGTARNVEGNDQPEYHQMDFLYGDIMTITPWGEDNTLRQRQKEANATVKPSRFIGFAIDNTNVAQQVTACQDVNNEYKPTINSGAYGDNTAAKYDEWMAKLDAAGINDIIAEYQAQLDAWLAQ